MKNSGGQDYRVTGRVLADPLRNRRKGWPMASNFTRIARA